MGRNRKSRDGTDDIGSPVTGSRVTGRFLNRLYIYNLACSGAVYD